MCVGDVRCQLPHATRGPALHHSRRGAPATMDMDTDASSAPGPRTASLVLAALRRRDAAQRDALSGVFDDYTSLMGENRALRKQATDLGKRVVILEHEAGSREGAATQAAGAPAGGRPRGASVPSDDAVVRKLKAKISQLQDDLTDRFKAESAGKEERLQLSAENRTLRDKLAASDASLKVAEQQLAASMAQATELKAQVAKLTEDNELIRGELRSARESGGGDAAEVRRLRVENEALVSRILDEKMKTVEQINSMNEEVERLKRQLSIAQRTRGDGSASGGGKGAASASGAGAPGLEELMMGAGSGGGASAGVPTAPAQVIKAHSTEINTVCMNDAGAFVITGSSDGTVKVWECATGKPRSTLRGTEHPVMCVASYGSLVAGGCNDRTLRVWDMGSERLRKSLGGHAGKIYDVQFRPDGRTVVTTGTDRKVKIWDLHSGNCVRTISSSSIVNALAVSPDGGLVATGHQDSGIRLWDARSGGRVAESKDAHSQAVTSLCFSGGDGGRRILSAGRDNTLRLLDSRTLLDADTGPMTDSAFRLAFNWSRAALSPGSAYAAAGSADGKVFFWDVASSRLESTAELESGAAIAGVAWSRDARTLASVDKTGTLVLWR